MSDVLRLRSRFPLPSGRLALLLSCAWCAATISLAGENERVVLYQTDFADFPVGDGELAGRDGWLSTHPEEIVHGIVDDFAGEGNRSATIGLLIPETTDKFISVYRPVAYDPLAKGTPLIEFSASVAVFDSNETTTYDSFHFSVFNNEDDLLAGVIFDNTEESFGIWRSDGIEFVHTGISFEHSVVYALSFIIDFEANTWTAMLDDEFLFRSAPFSNTGKLLDLGDVAAEWEITDTDDPGDNWLLFDDWRIAVVGSGGSNNQGEPLVAVTRFQRRPNGNIALRWSAAPNARYQVEASTDLTTWNARLPGSLVTTGDGETEAAFIDNSAASAGARYYRVRSL